MKPYGIVSDIHFHEWSAFSHALPSGINNRLQILIDEHKRCAAEVRKVGGDTIVSAGDTFHVRGSISPTVLNPVMDMYRDLIADGFKVVMIPGNHDLASKNSERLSNAVTALEGIGVTVIHEPTWRDNIYYVPWYDSIKDLKTVLETEAREQHPAVLPKTDLIIHAPVNGVIWGIPDHGLDAPYLASLGFRRVFAGHYHNHVAFEGGVYSIGATCHHTWSDVGTKAGFLIVDDCGGVTFYKSHAPEFVEITGDMDADEIPLRVDGNYVRCKVDMAKPSEIEALRYELMEYGARGVVIHAVKKPVTERSTEAPTGVTMQASIADFIKEQKLENPAALQALCERILNDAEAV